MVKNAYIHIPFCKGKCNYCSFVSFDKFNDIDRYIDALHEQITSEYDSEHLETLFFGGGTPSLLSIEQIDKIISLFNLNPTSEITFEVNPESVNEEYFKQLRGQKINRISVGAQSFDDKILSIIGRKHLSRNVFKAVNAAKCAGFDNISLDLIYGLPTQSLVNVEQDVKTAINLGVKHISLYGLKIEEGTYFYKHPPKWLPDNDMQADMYQLAVKILNRFGFKQYEISNFALEGFESKHNLNYWNNNSYYGFGCAASGYRDSIRYTNSLVLSEYINNPLKKESENKLTIQEILEEEIFLGLRKSSGINISELNNKFQIDFQVKYADIIQKYNQFLSIKNNYLTLSAEGMMICNEIMAEFID